MKFNSQICTSREQSERLLSLGLKKETADMYYRTNWVNAVAVNDVIDLYEDDVIPAWSLGRLIEMLPSPIKLKEDLPTFLPYACLGLTKVSVDYHWSDYDAEERNLVGFYGNGFFAAVVDAIEWLIKEGYFNEEYLNIETIGLLKEIEESKGFEDADNKVLGNGDGYWDLPPRK